MTLVQFQWPVNGGPIFNSNQTTLAKGFQLGAGKKPFLSSMSQQAVDNLFKTGSLPVNCRNA